MQNTYDVINFTDYNDVGETDIFDADMVINTIIKYLNVPLHFYVYSVTDRKSKIIWKISIQISCKVGIISILDK